MNSISGNELQKNRGEKSPFDICPMRLEVAPMKHVIQFDASIVFAGDTGKNNAVKTDDGQDSPASLDVLTGAIDQRANYIGPVLEAILHQDHEVWPRSLRE